MKRLAFALVAVLACSADAPRARDYPPAGALAVGGVLPDYAWEGFGEDGSARTIRMRDYYEPSGAGVLVIRVHGGAWCGTCLWHAAHTGELFALPRGDRLHVLDLVVGDRSNAPARPSDALAWRAQLDDRRVAVAADPSFSLRGLVSAMGVVMPMTVVVDTRTMKIKSTSSNPDPGELAGAIDAAFAAIDGVPPSPPPAEALVDGLFHRNEWEMIRAIAPPGAPPPDPSNEVGDDPAAAALGKALFFDEGISPANVACASCHDPARGLSDGRARAHGAGEGDRKTPRIALAAFSPRQFWDGRAKTLAEQALGPLENPAEMASSPAFVARRVATAFEPLYRTAFPTHPLCPDDPTAIARTFVDVGKAIAAYERTFRVRPGALDAYASGDFDALPFLQKQGLAVFAQQGCMQCHWGPRLTDDAFHVTRTPTGRVDGAADVGCRDVALGAFKTPSLRGVASATAFGHGGAVTSLGDVIASYGSGGLDPADARATGAREPWLPRFGETPRWSILALLSTLTSDAIVP